MEPPITNEEINPPAVRDRAAFENAVKTLSAVFRQSPAIADSEVRLSAQRLASPVSQFRGIELHPRHLLR
jgi:hypothetical protein